MEAPDVIVNRLAWPVLGQNVAAKGFAPAVKAQPKARPREVEAQPLGAGEERCG